MNNEEAQVHRADNMPTARMRWVGVGLVAVALAGLVWQAAEAGKDTGTPTAELAAVESLAHPGLVEMLASADATRLGAQAASAVAAARDAHPGSTLPSDEVEVCGVGRVKADDSGQPRDMAPVRRSAQRLREQIVSKLLASGDDTTRAAGLLLLATADSAGPDGAPGEGGETGAVRARDELATLAAFRSTPQVYAWAMRACHHQAGEGGCRLLSADQWARIEPANAVAWLHVAADAQVRHDDAAVAEAMYRVSKASKSDARFGSLVSVVLAQMPPEADLLARTSFAMEVAKLEARGDLPLVAASQHCAEAEVRDANRHQVCSDVAEMLSKRASTVLEASLGASIGERVGWPAERVSAAYEERDALMQMSAAPPSSGAWTCAGLTQSLGQLNEAGRHGELAAARSALKRSNDSAAVLAKRFRAASATRVASAASAASASSQ